MGDANLSELALRKRYYHLYERKKKVYRWLYEFTFGQCGLCVESGCACKDSICQHVEEQARKRGVDLVRVGQRLRFIGEKGCSVAPHLRETCTIYLCQKAQSQPQFDRERYQRLKDICDRIEWSLMEIEDQIGSVQVISST